MTLQNGLSNVETIAAVVGRERVIAGTTAHGATLLGPGLVRHAGEGGTFIGEMDGQETARLAYGGDVSGAGNRGGAFSIGGFPGVG